MSKRVDVDTQAAFTRHEERFAAFLQNTDQKRVTRAAITEGLQTRYPDVWAKAQDPARPFKAFYLGVGNGGLEIPLTQDLIAARGTKEGIKVVCEDPSQEMKRGFYDGARKAGIESVIDNYSLDGFDNSAYNAPTDADFSLASHVWYYVNGWKGVAREQNTLAKFADTTKANNGVGLITVHSKESDRYKLSSDFLRASNSDQSELAGEEVVMELERLRIPHQAEIIESHTDVSSIFPDGTFNPTYNGKLLLEFFLRSSWSDQPDDVKRQVQANLTKIVNDNGAPEMKFRDLYIWTH